MLNISRNDDEETVREILKMNVLEIIDDDGSEIAKKRKESVAIFNNQVWELLSITVTQRPNPRNDLRVSYSSIFISTYISFKITETEQKITVEQNLLKTLGRFKLLFEKP